MPKGMGKGFIHGFSKTPEYRIWAAAKDRCFSKTCVSYKNYGGRGITMCDKWRRDFTAFIADVGWRPSKQHTLDRTDNDGNYEPGNVKWVSVIEQANNQRRTLTITHNGKTMPLRMWATKVGLPYSAMYYRLKSGSPIAKILSRSEWSKGRSNPSRFITANGQTKSLAEWSRTTGLTSSRIQRRIDELGWTPEKAITPRHK